MISTIRHSWVKNHPLHRDELGGGGALQKLSCSAQSSHHRREVGGVVIRLRPEARLAQRPGLSDAPSVRRTQTMLYRNLGSSGVKVSPVCLGTMMFGGQTDAAESIRIMHKALDLGINFFDTADVYNAGQSEVVVGQALSDRRDKVILATKGCGSMGDGPNDSGASRRHLMQALGASLKRLKTDYVDIYYVHTPDYTTPIEETL